MPIGRTAITAGTTAIVIATVTTVAGNELTTY